VRDGPVEAEIKAINEGTNVGVIVSKVSFSSIVKVT
jgi:hypothetical protein